MKILMYLLAILVTMASCSPLTRKKMTRLVASTEADLQNHIGVDIYDPVKGRHLLTYRHDRYFTPASNTKVLTLYTALKVIGDSIPSLRVIHKGDSTLIWGMGDPCFLNPECHNNFRVFNFLNNVKGNLYFSARNFETEHFGRGWAWDDYNDYYSVERSPLPIYGNTFRVYPFPDQMLVTPSFFRKFYKQGPPLEEPKVVRDVDSNAFVYHPGVKKRFKSFTVPFHVEPSTICKLLEDTLRRKVRLIDRQIAPYSRTIYGTPSDSLYKVMMQESDNHHAEQLLLASSAVLSDTLKPEIAIKYMQEKFFKEFPDEPVWIDGSGLSRYNLFTPRFMVHLWNEIYKTVPRDRLFSIVAVGGRPGTLKNWFKAEAPYVFGKTGTLSNNHALSGYLVTKSGKILIFAFMNGNYVRPVSEVRTRMQEILNLYYEHY